MSGRGGGGGGGRGRASRGRGRGSLPPSIQYQLGLGGSHYQSTAMAASMPSHHRLASGGGSGSSSSSMGGGVAAGSMPSQAAMLNMIQSSIGEKLAPGPLFPETAWPVPPTNCSPMQKSLLLIHRALHQLIEHSPYHLQAKASPSDIQRYSDKYLQQKFNKTVKIHDIKTDISMIPEDLLTVYRPEKARASKSPNVAGWNGTLMLDLLRLEELEKKEGIKPDANGQEEDDDENPTLEEDLYEEDEFEEETDYNLNYFDPGEDYGDYDEGGGEEPYY